MSNYLIILKNILIILIVIYILFGTILFFFQKFLIYYPTNTDFEKCYGFKDYEKLNYNGTRFYLKRNSFSDVVIYYHGNAGSACDRSRIKNIFESSKKSVMFVEYVGYSNDDKKPSKNLLFKDVENVIGFIEKEGFENVTVYGQSIGSGMASYHANKSKVDSLILVTPFSSLKDVVKSKYPIYPVSLLLRENYDNVNMLKNYDGKLLIIHGDNDNVIPHKFSKILYDSVDNINKEYVIINGSGHNDIWFYDEYKETISRYLNK